jgi:ribosomal protein S18 acetylase RimI-like enzyme
MEILLARIEHLEEVSQLFDQYRMFYQQPSDLGAARTFMEERLQKGDSQILVAIKKNQSIGFTQLYPSFSSVSMKPIWILNDLFVAESDRQQGVAKLLIEAAANFARKSGAVRIALSTQITNMAAQSLYESLGFSKDQDFYHYALSL